MTTKVVLLKLLLRSIKLQNVKKHGTKKTGKAAVAQYLHGVKPRVRGYLELIILGQGGILVPLALQTVQVRIDHPVTSITRLFDNPKVSSAVPGTYYYYINGSPHHYYFLNKSLPSSTTVTSTTATNTAISAIPTITLLIPSTPTPTPPSLRQPNASAPATADTPKATHPLP